MNSKYFIWIVHVSIYLWEFSQNFENFLSIFRASKTFFRFFWNCFCIKNNFGKLLNFSFLSGRAHLPKSSAAPRTSLSRSAAVPLAGLACSVPAHLTARSLPAQPRPPEPIGAQLPLLESQHDTARRPPPPQALPWRACHAKTPAAPLFKRRPNPSAVRPSRPLPRCSCPASCRAQHRRRAKLRRRHCRHRFAV